MTINDNQWKSMKIENHSTLQLWFLLIFNINQLITIDWYWLILIVLIIDSHWLKSSGKLRYLLFTIYFLRVVQYTQLESIRLWNVRFVSIPSNRHESSPLLSIRKSGSRFARDFRVCSATGLWGWVENFAIRVDSSESTRIVSLVVDSWYRKSICGDLKYVAQLGF